VCLCVRAAASNPNVNLRSAAGRQSYKCARSSPAARRSSIVSGSLEVARRPILLLHHHNGAGCSSGGSNNDGVGDEDDEHSIHFISFQFMYLPACLGRS
jgi:hypothetical protein